VVAVSLLHGFAGQGVTASVEQHKSLKSRSFYELFEKILGCCRSGSTPSVDGVEPSPRPTGETTVQYLLLIYANEAAASQIPQAEREKSFGEWMSYTAELENTKAFVAGDALQPTATATSVRVRNGERMITDGPFAETKEQLGGYYLIEAANLDAALEWAAKCPGARTGTVEVRPIMVFG
jgi:hypothetical protein